MEDVRTEWSRLAERGANVFATWEWAAAWQRHLASEAGLSIAVAHDEAGEVAALVPLSIVRERPLRFVRIVGSGPSDECGPICAPADRPAAARAFAAHVSRVVGASGVFLAERLPGEEGFAGALPGPVIRRQASPVLRIEGRTFEQYLATRSRNFREQVRRRMRAAAREGFSFRLTERPEDLRRDMETLFALHRARWNHGESTVFEGPKAAFHLDFAARALEQGWLRLWTMEREGTAVAAWYGLRFAGREVYYQAGRDPAHERANVGFVLLCHTIRQAFGEGMLEYRFGAGGEAYKHRFADEHGSLLTVAVASGVRGRLALAGGRAALAAPKDLQRMIWRLSSGQRHAR